ncbi:hypothetical protein LguiB_007141 [Lonicera macranthoides]
MTRKVPTSRSNSDVDDDYYNVEYSFAVEYTGPPITFDVPRVVPIDVDRIPIAAVAVADSTLSKFSLPIIQPILKNDPVLKKLSYKSKLGCQVESFNERIPEMNRNESSGTLGFSDSRDESRELSASSGDEGLADDCKDNPSNWDLNYSASSSPVLSSRVSSCAGEDCIDESHCHGDRVVSFCDSESIGTVSEESRDEGPEVIEVRQKGKPNVKKGLCHRCLRGNRFTEKEVCLVCSAKYCSSCVLRAMGSMPEGRKCITCIGYPIDESNRVTLGKCSRMLKKLLTDFEVKRTMGFESSCEANQIPPQLVCVNGKPLCADEMASLLNCRNPPKRLKPGKYWYDKVSGFWGKEGERPSQIISPQLAVGNSIMKEASNGNTRVLINNREITEAELWMLKLAGVHCEGNPHFWVSADGSYQEEGQKNVMGKIWDKAGTRLVCAVLSLPFPSASINLGGEEVDISGDKVVPNEHKKQKPLNKFLLVGYDHSGTSTIFKQAKILYNSTFSEDERQNVKSMIQSNMYGYLGILLEARERFEEECFIEMRKKHINQPGPSENPDQLGQKSLYSISRRLKLFSDWLLQVMMSGNLDAIFPASTREYAPLVEELWKDKAFQATYSRRNELAMLPRVANYFLDRAVDIARADYEPSDMDILYADGITSSNGISCMEFSFPKPVHFSVLGPVDQTGPLESYQLIRVHSSSLGENCKWSDMFEDIDLILYCVALTDYDELFYNNNGVPTNKMLATKKLFENIITHPPFDKKNFLLILNKFDLLEEKIEHLPLTQCEWFQDFKPVISSRHSSCNSSNNNSSLAQSASHYIGAKFKRVFNSLNSVNGRKLFVSVVTGLETDSVGEALSYGREILKWDEERNENGDSWFSGSVEVSTSS